MTMVILWGRPEFIGFMYRNPVLVVVDNDFMATIAIYGLLQPVHKTGLTTFITQDGVQVLDYSHVPIG